MLNLGFGRQAAIFIFVGSMIILVSQHKICRKVKNNQGCEFDCWLVGKNKLIEFGLNLTMGDFISALEVEL